MPHFLSLKDLRPDSFAALIEKGIAIAKGSLPKPVLTDRIVGLYFKGSSTRTRTSFAVAALKLGASVIQYAQDDLQLVTGETTADTGHVLSHYLDALVVRTTGGDEEIYGLANQSKMAVVNAMSSSEHPTQAIGDLITIREIFGDLRGRHVLYMGEGNNTAAALCYAVALTPGMRLTLLTPDGYGLTATTLSTALTLCSETGAIVEEHHSTERIPSAIDAVYTTRWETMGLPHHEPQWREKFLPFRVTSQVMESVSHERTVFMHDLPAVRGQEVEGMVLDGARSVALRQAGHKLTSALVVLLACLTD